MTEEPYRKMSSNQEFHKTKLKKKKKNCEKAKAKCRECRQVRNLNLHKLYNGQTPEQKTDNEIQPQTRKTKAQNVPSKFFVLSHEIYMR